MVSPDACIDLDQVGVQLSIAQKQTIPDRVTNFNMSSMKKKILNRECNSIIKKAKSEYQIGQEIKIMYLDDEMLIKTEQSLEVGDVVERHLVNDDIVLFNRQPSLHAFSLMAHRVRIFAGQKTFRLNVQATTPYNADFDGDEMNMHTLQTVEARAEAMTLMSISNNLISPQASRPVLGLIQDVLLGTWMLTSKDTFFDKPASMQFLSSLHGDQWTRFRNQIPSILKPVQLWTGKQILSCGVLPSGLFLGPKQKNALVTSV